MTRASAFSRSRRDMRNFSLVWQRPPWPSERGGAREGVAQLAFGLRPPSSKRLHFALYSASVRQLVVVLGVLVVGDSPMAVWSRHRASRSEVREGEHQMGCEACGTYGGRQLVPAVW